MSKHNGVFLKEPILARILRWFVYAVAFMPLIIFSQYISPFHFGKVIVFRSIVEIMAVLYVMLVWRDRLYTPKPNPIFWAFLGFALAFTVTTVFSIDINQSFWGTLERMGGLWSFWHYFIFFVITTAVLRAPAHWYRFLELTLSASILSAIYGFGQKTNLDFFIGSGGRERIFGTIGNAALFAGYEIVNFFLALTLALRPGITQGKKIFYNTAVTLDGLAILMTVVRGSILGLGVGLFIFLSLYFVKFHSQRARMLLLVLGCAVAVFFLIIVTPIRESALFQSSRILHRLTDTSFDTFTAKTRFWAWQAGLKGWSEDPKTILLGWGPENFNIPFSKHFNPKFFQGPGSETLFDRAHNMFVEILVTMGLVGELAYLSLFAVTFLILRKLYRSTPEHAVFAIGFTSLLVAYMIHNSFIFDTSANFLVFFSVLGFIAWVYQGAWKTEDSTPVQTHQYPLQALRIPVGIVLAIMATVSIYKFNVLSTEANYATTRGIVYGWANDFSGAVAKYKEALSYDGPGIYDLRHRFGQYVLEYASDKTLTPEIEDVVKYAIQEISKNMRPNVPDYLPYLYVSRLNIVLGKADPLSPYNDEALHNSMKALEISPTFVRTYYEVAQAYLNKKDYDNAVKYFRKAAELNPDVGISYWYWGMTEIERGNLQEGLPLVNLALQKNMVLSEPDYLRLVNLYVKTNNLPGLVTVYRGLTNVSPKNGQYWAALAVAYARTGKINEAVDAAHKAVAIDPNFEKDARAFVQSLGRTW